MPFVFSKVLEHGTSNPIVARLGLQTMQLLDQCKIGKETRDKIAEIYMYSLQKKLVRCWEIKERFRSEFNSAVDWLNLDHRRPNLLWQSKWALPFLLG